MAVNIHVVGRIATNVELLKTVDGKDYVRFRLMVPDYLSKDEEVSWFTVFLFSRNALKLSEYLPKGRTISVSGIERVELYEKEDDCIIDRDILADRIDFLPRRKKKRVEDYSQSEEIICDNEEYRELVEKLRKAEPNLEYDDGLNLPF